MSALAAVSEATERVVRAVEQKTGKTRKRVGKEWSLLCPAHADHSPSLNIREGDAGYPVIVCRSHGCTPQQVLDAVGLGWGDIYERNDHWTPHGDAVAHYTYADERGEVLFQVLRTADKQFPCRHPDPSKKSGWAWSMGDKRALYRLPAVIAEAEFGGTVYVVEGEKDVEAAERAGMVATCNPGGAGNWRQEYAQWLRGANVIVVADLDEPGRAHARNVAETLDGVAESVRIVEPAVEKKGADLADHLAAGLTADQLAPFGSSAVESEPSDETEPDSTAADQPEPHSWTPKNLLLRDLDPPPPPTISGIIYPGRRHIFSGETESLKSFAVLVAVVDEMHKGECVLYIDHEMGEADVLLRLRSLGASDEQIAELFLYVEPEEPFVAPHILSDTMTLLEARKPSLVVIDAFTGALSLHGLDPNSGVDVEEFYRTVIDKLRKFGAAVVVLDHLPKDKENRGKYSIGATRKIDAAEIHISFGIIAPFGRGKTGRVGLHTKKDRPGYLARPLTCELILESNPETFQIAFEWKQVEDASQSGASFRPTKLMEKVSIWMEENPGQHSRKTIEEGVTGMPKFIRVAIDCLLKEGHMEEEKGAHRSRLNTLLKSYREADEPTSSSSSIGRHDDVAAFVPPSPSGTTSHGAKTNPQRGGKDDTSAASSSKRPADPFYDSLWFDGDPSYDDGVDF